MGISNRIFLLALKVCAQCGQTGRNADKIPRHTSKVNYVRIGLHCALVSALLVAGAAADQLYHAVEEEAANYDFGSK